MTETTEIKLKLDLRSLKEAGSLLTKVFSRSTGQQFNQEMRQVNRLLQETVRETTRIAEAMTKVDRESEAYERLADRLQAANREAKLLQQTLRTQQGAAGAGGGGGGSGGGGGFGFKPGFQLPMPGQGAIGTALAGLPIAGGILAGAYMASMQSFGSHTAMQQSQMMTAPYLMRAAAAANYSPDRYDITGPDRGLVGSALTGAGRALFGGPTMLLTEMRNRNAQGTRMPFDVAGLTAAGLPFGVKPQQALQTAAVLSQAMGAPAGAADLEQALGLRQTFGLGAGQIGSFRRSARRTSFGGEAQGSQLTMSIAAALRLGLETSEISDYLQEQTGYLKSLESQGIQVVLPEMLAVQEALAGNEDTGVGGIGIRGFRAQAITQGFAQGAMRVGQRGLQSAGDVRLMRAMGYTGTGGPEEYARVLMEMQNPGLAARALPGYLQSFTRGMDPGSDFTALAVQRAMSAMGVQVGPAEAKQLAAGAPEMMAKVQASMAATATNSSLQAQGDRFNMAGRDLASATGGTIVQQAAIEQQRIDSGRKVAQAMVELESTTVNLANMFGNTLGPKVEEAAMMLERLTNVGDQLTNNLWTGSLFPRIRQ